MSLLREKVALVTGGSRGIGRAIAVDLAAEGALVAVNYAGNKDAADEAVALIKDAGGDGFTIQAKIGTAGASTKLFAELTEQLKSRGLPPQFDILVNNAGIGLFHHLAETTPEELSNVMEVNVNGTFLVTQAALKLIRDGGRIICISSGQSIHPQPEVIAYSMTKAAINAMVRAAAKDLGARQITVNALGPGWTETKANADELADEQLRSDVINNTALKRLGKPEDIAKVATFLASSNAAWITGQYIEASGGFGL